MKKSQMDSAKKYLMELITKAARIKPDKESDLSLTEIKKLNFLVDNGHWEVLPRNKIFLQLAPEGQIQTLKKALDERVRILTATLMPLGRGPRTRDAYIQVLNHIHDLERLGDEVLEQFYAKLGKRQIDKDSKGKKYDF